MPASATCPRTATSFPTLTVHQNLLLGCKSAAPKGRWSFDDMYRLFPRLKERQHNEAGVLSGGEQQMLTLCRTLMGDPDLVMIDEPTEGLAPKIVELVAEFLRELKRRGISVLLVEQKLTIALEVARPLPGDGPRPDRLRRHAGRAARQRRHPQGVARGVASGLRHAVPLAATVSLRVTARAQHAPPRIARPFDFSGHRGGTAMTASYEVRGNVAVITLNNPPVNGLGYDTRRGIADGMDRANADAAVKAIVITGAGKAFSGGADIREFGSPKAIAEPNLLSLWIQFEGSAKPIVAAMHTVVHGRRAGTGAGLPLPRGRARHAGGAARGQARPGAGCRRHAAPAARAGRGDRAEHDRQRRAGEERAAGRRRRARSCSTS